MNQDAREDHTLRNALLLTGGLAAGGIGGIKLAEKAAMKNIEKAGTVKIMKNLENGGAIVKVNKASAKTGNSKIINKTASKVKTPAEIQEDVDRLKKLLAQEELILIEAEKGGNNAKIAKSKDLINKMRKALAALGVPINA